MDVSPQKDKMRAKLQDVGHKGVRPQKDNARESPETV